jgi:hypothetical protein
MIKKISVLSMLALSALTANAATYQVSVVLNVESTPLEIMQTQVMAFPELVIDRASQEGWGCTTATNVNPDAYTQKLCPDNSGAQRAVFQLTGTPNAMVTYTFSGSAQEQNGITFNATDTTDSRPLDSEGALLLASSAYVTLTDKELAMSTPGTRTFTYGFTAAYQ